MYKNNGTKVVKLKSKPKYIIEFENDLCIIAVIGISMFFEEDLFFSVSRNRNVSY